MNNLLSSFEELISILKKKGISTGILHTQNTPAVLQYPDFKYDYIRVGSLLLGIPYGDIALSPQAAKFNVIINGHLAEVIGNICMDQLIINVTSIPHIQEGDIVTLIGSADGYTISLDYIAQMMNTQNNEIVLHINARVPRVYIKGNEAFIKFLIF